MSFNEKQQLRQDELDALAKATEILANPNIGASAAKRTLFLQATSPWAIRVSQLLSKASEKFGDKQLALMAEKATKDPFGKVKKMIASMINRLLEEANAEAEKKGFCDKELKVNKQVRAKLTGQMEDLAAELDMTLADNQKLSMEIAQLQKDISLLDEQRASQVETRNKENKQNEQTIEEAKQAQVAVGQARNVIADFYAKAGTATAFVQMSRPTMGSPEWNALANPDAVKASGYGQGSEDKIDEGHTAGMQTFGENYQGQQDSAGGVLSMLSVIASDFSNLQADTEAAEAQSLREFEQFMADTQQDKAVKSKQVDMKTNDLAAGKTQVHNLKQDLNGTDDELRAANRYFDQLKPQCLVTVSYEERVKRREEEIESLKEALQILSTAESV
jgi:ribosomal protein L22